MRGERFDVLDALRGLAAVTVVGAHALGMGFHLGPITYWLFDHTPLRVFDTGRAPVLLFLVLSGYVLTLSLRTRVGGGLWLGAFALRRTLRLLPPVAASVLLAALLRDLTWGGPVPEAGWLLQGFLWREDWTPPELLLRSLLIGAHGDFGLNPPLWSLVHEWRISLVLPAFLLFRARPALLLALALLLQAAAVAAGAPQDEAMLGRALHSTLVATAYFVLPFAAGAALAFAPAGLRLRGEARLAAWITVVAACALPSDLAVVIGSVLLIVLLRGPGRAPRLLSTPAPLWLGRVSFSLYLVHVPVLAAMVHGTAGLLPPGVAVVLGVPAALAAAALFHALVEEPSHRLSRKVRMGRPEGDAARDRRRPAGQLSSSASQYR